MPTALPNALELRAERARVAEQTEQMLNRAEQQGRDLTKNEKADYEANAAKLDELNARIKRSEDMERRELESAVFPDRGGAHRGHLGGGEVSGYLGSGQVRTGVALPAESSFRDLPAAAVTASGAFGRYLRRMALGQHDEIRDEFGTADAPGMLPVAVIADLFDAARARSRVMQAGAQVIPLAEGQVKASALVDDPVPAWRDEHAQIPESNPTVTSVTFDPKALAVVSKVSWEVLQDASPSVEAMVTESIGAAFALEWDRAALLGSGQDSEPRGLLNTAGVPTTEDVGALDYDALIDGVSAVRGRNFDPGRYIGTVRDHAYLAKLKDGHGRYLEQPSYLDPHLPLMDTTKLDEVIPDEGADEGHSKLVVGQWNRLLLGVRMEVNIMLLRERYADHGQLGIVGFFRGDVRTIRPTAFQVLDGVTNPAPSS